jgi:DNA polymerase-1
MYHIIHKTNSKYPIALLIKHEALQKDELEKHYIDPLGSVGDSVISFSLEYNKKKLKASEGKEYLNGLLHSLVTLGTETLYVADAEYFKLLSGERKTTSSIGYVFPCIIKGYEHMNVILGLNYKQLFFDPSLQTKLDMSLDTLRDHVSGSHVDPGKGIIHYEYYPSKVESIRQFLDSLHAYPELSCDIETFSLKFWEAGIATIAFAWDKHNGGAFACDYHWLGDDVSFGMQEDNQLIKGMLRHFFDTYKGKLIFHNVNFDSKVLIYELYMRGDLLDNAGLIDGLNILGENIDDTKIITYLATNSCAGNTLGLKENAHEFAGNYAQEDIKDIKLIKLPDLLRYNLVDCLSTNYVKEKNYPVMIQDSQEDIYRTIMLPSIKTILQMELTGMPLDMPEVLKVQAELSVIEAEAIKTLMGLQVVQDFTIALRKTLCFEDNLIRERKPNSPPKPLSAYDYVEFNPNSGPQLQKLIYAFLNYDVIDYTDTKLPATGAKTIKKLIHRSTCKEHTELFETLIKLSEVSKILGTFIKAFIENSVLKADGVYYLHGSFNLGGTVSNRLSSSQPNLTNIPSGSTYAKAVKRCFKAPKGWLFGGADFSSLEDYISALSTRDPNKLRVYLDKYCGHCLRAASYFREELPHIDLTDPTSVNSIKHTHPNLRQDSKPGTFLLTYGGTYRGMMNNLGWSEEKAKRIEKAYHDMYFVSDEWVAAKLKQASKDGYVTGAFGLRVRTPILAQTILGNSHTPFEAEAEGRTAGNALGQSWCKLTDRAANEFMDIVRNSVYKHDIKICAQIHDSIYLIWKNDLGTTKFVNDNLIKCMEWQDDPLIAHDIVKLGAELDICFPTWVEACTIPNNANIHRIKELCIEHSKKVL